MDVNFCKNWIGDGNLGENQYCRSCSSEPCKVLWRIVKEFSNSSNGSSIDLPKTKDFVLNPSQNEQMVYFHRSRTSTNIPLPKEDFLYFVKTGWSKMGSGNQRYSIEVAPTGTRKSPYVDSLFELIQSLPGGSDAIKAVKSIPKKN